MNTKCASTRQQSAMMTADARTRGTNFAANVLILIMPFFSRVNKCFLTFLQLPCQRLELLNRTNILLIKKSTQDASKQIVRDASADEVRALLHLLVVRAFRILNV